MPVGWKFFPTIGDPGKKIGDADDQWLFFLQRICEKVVLMRPSRILKDCANGRLATCVKSNFPDPHIIELAGMTGFSSCWICNEHVPQDWKNVEEAVRAAKIHDLDIIVRISKGSYSDYVRPLECDAAGIMVPHVTSAAEARTIVDMCRFQPLGNRALDGGNADGGYCTIPMAEYLEASNREKIIILQIESPEGVEAVDEIAAVKGFDFLLFGPGDYSHRIGKPGDINDPEVLAARAKVEAATLKHGKRGFAVGAQGNPKELIERGYGLINLGSDVVTLTNGFKGILEKFCQNVDDSGAYYSR